MRTLLALLLGAALAVAFPHVLRAVAGSSASPDAAPSSFTAPWGRTGMGGTDTRAVYRVQLTAGTPSNRDFTRPDESLVIEVLREERAPGSWISWRATRLEGGEPKPVGRGSARIERIEQASEMREGRMHLTTTYVTDHARLKVFDPSPSLGGRSRPSRFTVELSGRLASVFVEEGPSDPGAVMELAGLVPRQSWTYGRD